MDPIPNHRTKPDLSELVLNPDGSVYHLGLFPSDISDRIILVGDPGRVKLISEHFDAIEIERSNREFLTRTGTFKGESITVMSTGIGTDNIDIVLTELDVLASFDLKERRVSSNPRTLDLIRVGTSGALQADLSIDTLFFSELVIGMDGVMHAYEHRESDRELRFRKTLSGQVPWPSTFAAPYVAEADPHHSKKFKELERGITVTAHGFYGLQGRSLRLPLAHPDLNEALRKFELEGLQISNFEMESSALYGLASSLGHRASTICLIIANRYSGQFSPDHKRKMEESTEWILERIIA